MQSIEGIVTIVQEGRFQLIDSKGVGHHFLLSRRAAVEPEQLPALQREQAHVRVWFRPAPGVIGHIAERIALSPAPAAEFPGTQADGSAQLDRPRPAELGMEPARPEAGGSMTEAAHKMHVTVE